MASCSSPLQCRGQFIGGEKQGESMRNFVKVTIDAEGRDKGKTFIIHEMAAMPLEDWAIRAFIGLKNSGVEIDDEIAASGIAGMVRLGLSSFLAMDITCARPLMK